MRAVSNVARLRDVALLAVSACFLGLATPATARGDPPFTPAERSALLDSGLVEVPALDAFDSQERVPVLILLALPADARAPRKARWSERAAERAAIVVAADRVLAALGGELDLHHRYRSTPLVAGSLSRAGLRRLLGHPDVAGVALDTGGEGALFGAVPHIDLDLARAVYDGTGVTVAVIDSGVDSAHPDLADAVVGEACFCRTDGGCCPNGSIRQLGPGSAIDSHGHGTAVAGIVTSNGVVAPPGGAPGAAIVSVRMMGLNGYDNVGDPFAALDWILNERPDVDLINMSIASTDLFEGDCDGNVQGLAYSFLADQLRAEGVVSFAAAGNHGSSTAMSSPGCVSGIISVGAVYENGTQGLSDQVAEWSNASETTDVLAPGTDTDTTGIGGGTWFGFAGTSAATPLVVACAATLLQANPGLAPDLLEAALESSSTRVFDPRNGYEYPRVDCEEAHAFVRGACADALDNDRDGASDLDDAGCPFAEARPENPACDDGVDNDGDGLTDFDDPNCSPTWPYSEKRACGLGAELVVLGVLAPLLARRKRAPRASACR